MRKVIEKHPIATTATAALLGALAFKAGGNAIHNAAVENGYINHPATIPDQKAIEFVVPEGEYPSRLAAELAPHSATAQATINMELQNQEHDGVLGAGDTVRVERSLVEVQPTDIHFIDPNVEAGK